ncbi:MAG: hypothetical protein ACK4R8_10410, partial [Thiobacillus sp.]
SIVEQMPPLSTDSQTYAGGKVIPTPLQVQGPFAQAHIVARLPLGMVGDQRGQLALVSDFMRHLSSQPETMAILIQPPIDTQSGKTLKSGDEKGVPEAPRFVFRIIRHLRP